MQETACVYFTEGELNYMIEILEANGVSLSEKFIKARKNIFRY